MSRYALVVMALVSACGGDDVACDDGALQCSEEGDILEECVDGQWAESDNCGEQGMMCHEEMGHCMMPTT